MREYEGTLQGANAMFTVVTKTGETVGYAKTLTGAKRIKTQRNGVRIIEIKTGKVVG